MQHLLVDTKGTPVIDLVLIGPGIDGVKASYTEISKLNALAYEAVLPILSYSAIVTALLVVLILKRRKGLPAI